MLTSSFDQYLENRLQEWADWYIRGNSFGLGYPSRSSESRPPQESYAKRSMGSRSFYVNEPAEEIEKLVKEMAGYNLDMANAIRCQYFEVGSLRTRAAYLKMSHSRFKHYVDMAHQWLTGRLSAKQ